MRIVSIRFREYSVPPTKVADESLKIKTKQKTPNKPKKFIIMNAKFTKMVLTGISQDPKFLDRLAYLVPELGDEKTLMKLSEGVKTGIRSVDLEGVNADKKLVDNLKSRDMENYQITDISYYSTDEVKVSYEYDRTRWFDDPENAKKYEKDGETWNRNAKETVTDTHTFSANHHFSSSTTRGAEKLENYVVFDIL